jgi:hypothetical protein
MRPGEGILQLLVLLSAWSASLGIAWWGGMKRDLTGGMTRMLKAATTARRSLVNRSTAPRLHFQIFRL